MSQPTPMANDLEAFAARARDYADEHRLPGGHPIPPIEHREELRFKIRLEGWDTAITYWYFIHSWEGEWWRHLIIQVSIYNRLGEPLTAGEIATYKKQILGMCEGQVKLFFPLHDEISFKLDVRTAVPVQDPRNGQVSYRTPIAFHFLVKADTGEGMVGTRSTGTGRRGALVGPDGRPLRSTSYRNVADQVDETARNRPRVGQPANALPFNRAARRHPPKRSPDTDTDTDFNLELLPDNWESPHVGTYRREDDEEDIADQPSDPTDEPA